MRVEFAHLREQASNGQYVNIAIFTGVAPNSDTTGAKNAVLNRLVLGARSLGLAIEQAAFVYSRHGQIVSWGDPLPLDFLKKVGVPAMNKAMEIEV